MSYQKRLLGQQLGAFVFRDPPLVIANHDLAEVIESGTTFWEPDHDKTEGTTLSGMSFTLGQVLPQDEEQTIFWGDGTSDTFESEDSLTHTWPSSYPEEIFTDGQIIQITNNYMSGNYVRGSSNFYEKLI
jgi:hypothetical protein